MTRAERRLLLDTGLIGLLLTLLVVVLDQTGVLTPLERYFYDFRARKFQFHTPAPTDKLVHIDVDDAALEAIGSWPWPRSTLAQIVDEIHLAGAEVLALDVIFPEAQGTGYEELPDPPQAPGPAIAATDLAAAGDAGPAQPPARIVQARTFDQDEVLAESLRKFGKVIVPLSLTFSEQYPADPVFDAMLEEFSATVDLDRGELQGRLLKRGLPPSAVVTGIRDHFLAARKEAVFRRIDAAMRRGAVTLDMLRAELLPRVSRAVTGSPLLRLLEGQYARAQSLHSLRRFALQAPEPLPPLLSTPAELATVRALGVVAASSGYVDYLPMDDGIVRSVPLVAIHRDSIFPQLGLALACSMLRVNDIQIAPDRINLVCADGTAVSIPVHHQTTRLGRFAMFFDIPWFGQSGPTGWQTMYDHPRYAVSRQHVPVSSIWEIRQFRQRIIHNNSNVDKAISIILGDDAEYKLRLAPARARRYFADLPDLEDTEARRKIVADTLQELVDSGWRLEDFEGPLTPNQQFQRDQLLFSLEALKLAQEENENLMLQVSQARANLRNQLNGRAALMGYIAVGAIADVVTTSLHPRCPGVVVHGVIFNAIMSRDFWRTLPPWITVLTTILLGLLMTVFVLLLSPWRALAASALLAAVFLFLNGYLLFDYGNYILGVAAPLAAITTVWAGGTLTRYVREAAERTRVTRRFQSYVDPTLVNYVIEHEGRVDGQLKELTVVFTDLQGFTALSEALGERTVAILNEYTGVMVPIIRRNGGYLNKFLGDGIMYFFGAPRENLDHAVDAVSSVLQMQQAAIPLNQSLAQRGLPTLSIRAGISSGDMVVGDAGPADGTASDYTVLGDNVNLGARLETANKAFGSLILINQRARDLIGDRFLVRPLGNCRVVGKQQSALIYEPLAEMAGATEQQRHLADMTSRVVDAFRAARFHECLDATARMEELFGASGFINIYRRSCQPYLNAPPPPDFDGEIALTEK